MTRSAFAVVLAMIAACGEPTDLSNEPATVDIQVPDGFITTKRQVQLTAEVRAADGRLIEDAFVRWQSGDTTRMKVDANGLLTTVEQYPECNNLMYGYPYCATGITATAGNAHDEVLINLYPRLQYIMPQSVTLAVGETAPYIEPRAVEDDRTLCSYFPVIHFDTTIAKLVRLETDPPSLAIMGVAPGSTQMYFIASSGKLCRSSQPGFVVTVIP